MDTRSHMNHVERFRAVMNFQPIDRLPRWEWAMWWDQTIERWHGEGLSRRFKFSEVFDLAQHLVSGGVSPFQGSPWCVQAGYQGVALR